MLDNFTKITLVLIVLFLAIIALRPLLQENIANANPGAKFDYLHIYEGLNPMSLIVVDTRNGNVWFFYEFEKPPEKVGRFKLEDVR